MRPSLAEWGRYTFRTLSTRAIPPRVAAEAALVQAAHDTLAVTCPAQQGATAAALAAALGAVTDQAARANGVDVGRRAAAAVLGARVSVSVVLRQLVGQPGRSLVDDARFLALAEIAWFDAYVSLFEGKYHYRFWRPITAIRNADLDGNDATAPQRDWTPLRETPPHPEYPCGHCVSAAAVGAVIAAEFGERMPSIVIDRPGSTVHRFDTAQEYVDEVSISRLYAGAHPRFSVEAGKVSGTAIGRFVVERYFRPLADARP